MLYAHIIGEMVHGSHLTAICSDFTVAGMITYTALCPASFDDLPHPKYIIRSQHPSEIVTGMITHAASHPISTRSPTLRTFFDLEPLTKLVRTYLSAFYTIRPLVDETWFYYGKRSY